MEKSSGSNEEVGSLYDEPVLSPSLLVVVKFTT